MDPYAELRSQIASVRARWTRARTLSLVSRASSGAAVLLTAGLILDLVLRPQGFPLVVLAGATGILSLALLSLAVWWMPRRPSDRKVARFIEERAARLPGRGLDDSLVSAIDAAERPPHARTPFLPLMLGAAVHRLRGTKSAEIVPSSDLRNGALSAASGLALLGIAVVASAPFFERSVTTARLRVFPGSVRVEVSPGNVRVLAGAPLRIRASLHGSSGALKRFTPELTVAAGGERRTAPMVSTGEAFEYTIGSVDRTFTYTVRAGAAESSRYTVTALTAPRVEGIDLHYIYPSFSGLAPREEKDGGDIYAPAGTRVRLRIHTDRPVAHGSLALSRSPAVSLRPAGARTVEAELLLAKDDSYRIRLTDGGGLKSSGEAEYFIRLMDDRPPDVRILRPSADQQITPLEEVPIEARADDDYGIAKFELLYSVAGGTEHVVPFERLSGTSIQKIGTRLLPAEDLGVKPGDVITYYARARDIGRGKRSTEATSDIFFLEVQPFNGEFVAAESQAGVGSDPQIEGLIEAQKEIISSTWNVERRSQGGRSADDVKAIAAAQAELKGRAERQLMSRTSRGRGRTPAPERQAPAGQTARATGSDPIANAVEAMGKALQHLATERTKDALTHEMAALNGLLQAQAEVRRRQVSQQANGAGSGGSNRAGQDLSALFDKELQRQQRTNYETRPSVASRRDETASKGSEIDRIRDLARRQEDLNRRQRALTQSNLGADEMKRQLETLTREQTALREQAEELLRRRGEPNQAARGEAGRQGSGARGASGSQDPGDLRDAAEQMRSAASDLRREDPGGAARSGARAAEQLRRLERQMQGENSKGSERAGSGLKLEAQQIAQEQRQLADRLDQARAIRDRVQRAEQQLRAAETREGDLSARRGSSPARGPSTPSAGQGSRSGAGEGGRQPGNDVQRLRDQYHQELQRARDALGRLAGGEPRSGTGTSAPEDHQFSRSAPGTEAFKQDLSGWESLRRSLDTALEKYEVSVSDRLSRKPSADRFSAGGSDRVPDSYQRLIARYFESLAKKKQP